MIKWLAVLGFFVYACCHLVNGHSDWFLPVLIDVYWLQILFLRKLGCLVFFFFFLFIYFDTNLSTLFFSDSWFVKPRISCLAPQRKSQCECFFGLLSVIIFNCYYFLCTVRVKNADPPSIGIYMSMCVWDLMWFQSFACSYKSKWLCVWENCIL